MSVSAILPGVDTFAALYPLLVEVAVKGSLLLALAGMAALALGRASAAIRHMVWAAAAAGLLLLPPLTLTGPAWPLPFPAWPPVLLAEGPPSLRPLPVSGIPSATESPGARHDRLTRAPENGGRGVWAGAAFVPGTDAVYRMASMEVRGPGMPFWLTLLWLAGVGILLVRLGVGYCGVCRVLARARLVEGGRLHDRVRHMARRLQLIRRVRLYRGGPGQMPMTGGWMRPWIVLPAESDRWETERLEMVLFHELAHIRRRDCLTQLVGRVALALYWYNPLVWVLVARLREERERASDDCVVASGVVASTYAGHLLALAQALPGSARRSWPVVPVARRSRLACRLDALLDPRVPHGPLPRVPAMGVVLAGAALVLSLAGMRPEPVRPRSDDVASSARAPEASHPALHRASLPARVAPRPPVSFGDEPVRWPVRRLRQSDLPPLPGKVSSRTVRGTSEANRDHAGGAGKRQRPPSAEGSPASVTRIRIEGNRIEVTVEQYIDAVRNRVAERWPGTIGDAPRWARPTLAGEIAVEVEIGDPIRQMLAPSVANPVRERIICELAEAEVYEAVPILMNLLLDDASRTIRAKAARALGDLGDARALAVLRKALEDPDAGVRIQARRALLAIRE